MMPIGPLMIEHRLIERMITLLKEALREAEEQQRVDPRFIDSATRFIREYADLLHGEWDDLVSSLEGSPEPGEKASSGR